MRISYITGIFLAFIFSCRPSQIVLPPLHSEIERIEGYASIRIKSAQGSARSKFSFLFQLPNQGRLEVSNLLGRTLYQIIIDEEEAFFVIPSKRVYWQGEEEEIIDRFLGFRLNLQELISLMSGQWREAEWDNERRNWSERWHLERDEKGKITSGQRGELWFEVEEFFENTSFVRFLVFEHPFNSGSLKILAINFNQPLKKDVFSFAFLSNYEKKTWDEIEEILDSEN